MNADRFDWLTALLGRFTSRRSLLNGIAARGAIAALSPLAAGVLSGSGTDVIAGKKRRKPRKKKKKKNQCNSDNGCPQPEDPCKRSVCRGHKCKEQNQPDGTSCGEGLVCNSGGCECPLGEKFCEGQCILDADPCFARVTPVTLQGWLLFGEDDFSNDPLLTQIVSGPGVPPVGEGSVKLDPTAFNGFSEDQTQAVLRTLQYAGTTIEDLSRLNYSIYVPASAGDPPTMQLAITGDFNSEQFASLVFLPGANGNPAPLDDDWSNFTPSDEGFWILDPGHSRPRRRMSHVPLDRERA